LWLHECCRFGELPNKDEAEKAIKLTFVADKPPPPQVVHQELLLAAESSAEYLSGFFSCSKGEVRLISSAFKLLSGFLASPEQFPTEFDIP
jgi:hypothetical protein